MDAADMDEYTWILGDRVPVRMALGIIGQ